MPTPPAASAPRTALRAVGLLLMAGIGVRALLASAVPLLPDEAYYWEWSRRLAPGYFDHPPGIAWLIAAGTRWLGATAAGVRLGPALAAVVATLAIVALARRVAEPDQAGAAAARAALLVLVLPLATLGLVLATPDAPLLACTALALLAVDRALAAPRRLASTAWWLATGLFVGAAMVAKYMGVLVGGAIALALLLHPALRRELRRPGPWLAGLVALLTFAPVVLWNALEDWVSFRFQLGHGFGAGGRGSALTRELELVGGQLALATPVLAVLLARAVLDAWRDRHAPACDAPAAPRAARRALLALAALVPAAFFALSALRKPVEANWLALCYAGAIPLLATARAPWATGRWWRIGTGLAGALLAVAIGLLLVPGSPLARNRQLAELHGWPRLAQAVERALRDPWLDGTIDRWPAANRYQDAAQLAFHLPGQPIVFAMNRFSRPNQYDLWQRRTVMNAAPPRLRPGDGLVAVFPMDPRGDSAVAEVRGWFAEARPAGRVFLAGDGRGGRQLWQFRLYRGRPGDEDSR